MERIVITIHPAPSDTEKLDVSDAMQQVIDAFKLLSEAERAITSPRESFRWKLESASANSPFTIVAVAEAVNSGVDVSDQVRKVKQEFSSGLRKLINESAPAWWMGPSALGIAGSVFGRGTNGISNTEIDLEQNDKLILDRPHALLGARAISAITAISVGAELEARESYGELRGTMVAAGKYRGKPAIQIRTEQYGFVWCQFTTPRLIEEFGDAHVVSEIWEGKNIGVEGKFIYADGGKLSRLEASKVREIEGVPHISLGDVVDKDFTAGLDPVEYLRRLHEGELA